MSIARSRASAARSICRSGFHPSQASSSSTSACASTSSASFLSKTSPQQHRSASRWTFSKLITLDFSEEKPMEHLEPPPAPAPIPKPKLAEDDCFHLLSKSPFASMRKVGEEVRKYAWCPVCLEQGKKVHPAYDCPDSGYPIHCSREHWEEDPNHWMHVERLREANEIAHDTRSGRQISELVNMPGSQEQDAAINFSSWESFFYTRGFPSLNSAMERQRVSKALTYPITIGSILHELSPYVASTRRLTKEGRRSLAALRSTLHTPPSPKPVPGQNTVVRIFVLGARTESILGPFYWKQLALLFPRAVLKVFFIGDEVALPKSWNMHRNFSTGRENKPEEVSSYGSKQHVAVWEEDVVVDEPEKIAANDEVDKIEGSAATDAATASTTATVTPTPASDSSTPDESASSTTPSEAPKSDASAPVLHRPPPPAIPKIESTPENDISAAHFPDTGLTKEGRPSDEVPTTWSSPIPYLLVEHNGTKGRVPSRDETENFGVPAYAIPVNRLITITSVRARYEDIHEQFGPFDPYSDVFFNFNPGLGFPVGPPENAVTAASSPKHWGPVLPLLLETKCPIFFTGYSPTDVERDVAALNGLEGVDGEFDWIMTPGENIFGSLQWEIPVHNPLILMRTNWGVWGIRGKLNELAEQEGEGEGLVEAENTTAYAEEKGRKEQSA